MNDRPRRRAWLALVPVAAVVLVVAFVIANGGTTLPPAAVTSTAPVASATGIGHATAPPAALGARHAVVSGSLTFTRESDGANVGKVNAPVGFFAVSPDGTRVAYFPGPGFNELWIADVAHLDRARRVLAIAPRFSSGVVWSTDGKGVMFGTSSVERVGVGGEPVQATLEGFHLEGDHHEVFVSQPNLAVRPLLWVREPKIVAAVTPAGQKGPGGYVAISGGAAKSWSIPDATRADVTVGWPLASSDGRSVAAMFRYGTRTLLRVWPSEDLSRATDLEHPGREIRSALWRPRGDELAVDVGGALELWHRNGGRRPVADLGGRSLLFFRWDGSAVYAGTMGGPPEVIEVDTGRRAPLPQSPVMGASPIDMSIVASARLE